MGYIKSKEVMKSLTQPNVRDRMNTENLIDKLVVDRRINNVINKIPKQKTTKKQKLRAE